LWPDLSALPLICPLKILVKRCLFSGQSAACFVITTPQKYFQIKHEKYCNGVNT